MYMVRKFDKELTIWRNEKEGKPLLIRGARQVGKSTAISGKETLKVVMRR